MNAQVLLVPCFFLQQQQQLSDHVLQAVQSVLGLYPDTGVPREGLLGMSLESAQNSGSSLAGLMM